MFHVKHFKKNDCKNVEIMVSCYVNDCGNDRFYVIPNECEES